MATDEMQTPLNPLAPQMRERVDPVYAKIWDESYQHMPAMRDIPIEFFRTNATHFFGEGPTLECSRVEDTKAGSVPVRLFYPKEMPQGPLGILVHYHGGGFTCGELELDQILSSNYCNLSQCLVVSVGYRLAPEAQYPAAIDDAWSAFLWARENAKSLGADPERMSVGGESAGGCIAAVMALKCRDAKIPLKLQILTIPVTDAAAGNEKYPSRVENDHIGAFVTNAEMAWFKRHYFGPDQKRAEEWQASPIRAGDFSGLAPAVVSVAQCDVLRDEGVQYAERLKAAGVDVTLNVYEQSTHIFIYMDEALSQARDCIKATSQALKKALA